MLPASVLNFLGEAAAQARVALPDRDSSLFQSGVLDSFSLIDFVTLLESECDIRIDDVDLRPEVFETIAKAEAFVARAKAAA